jgi:hypothetical protein
MPHGEETREITSTGTVLYSRENRTLRTELSEYELLAYLQKRNNGTDQIFDSISWSAYRPATVKLVYSPTMSGPS